MPKKRVERSSSTRLRNAAHILRNHLSRSRNENAQQQPVDPSRKGRSQSFSAGRESRSKKVARRESENVNSNPDWKSLEIASACNNNPVIDFLGQSVYVDLSQLSSIRKQPKQEEIRNDAKSILLTDEVLLGATARQPRLSYCQQSDLEPDLIQVI